MHFLPCGVQLLLTRAQLVQELQLGNILFHAGHTSCQVAGCPLQVCQQLAKAFSRKLRIRSMGKLLMAWRLAAA
jgi:hypothetical protein